MRLLVDKRMKLTQSRIIFMRLVSMQLRLLELWREASGGFQEAVVQMAIAVILGDRFTRGGSDPNLRNMSNPVPTELLLTKCNLSSIAAGTGLNRETVRRIVNRLILEGRLVRSADKTISYAAGWAQRPMVGRLGEEQLDEFCRTANLLIRDGVLSFERGMVKTKPGSGQISL